MRKIAMKVQLQISGKTDTNRYPEIFGAAAKLRPNAKDVLSFGCSTGEEVISLQHYFPQAKVAGAEINAVSRSEALKRFPDQEFLAPDKMDGRQFDLIFAMSVLCRWPDTDGFLEFAVFKAACQSLNNYVRPGALIVSYNATYDLRDALPSYKGVWIGKSSGFIRARDPDGTPRDAHPFTIYEKPAS